MRSVKTLILSTLIFTSCGQETLLKSDNDLKENIKEEITSGQKSLDLKKLTEFQWDSLLILTPYVDYDEIENQFDINLTQIKHSNIESRDDINQLIFFNDQEPIKMVEFPRFPGDFSDNGIEFIEKDSAIFDIVVMTEKTVGGDNLIKLIRR